MKIYCIHNKDTFYHFSHQAYPIQINSHKKAHVKLIFFSRPTKKCPQIQMRSVTPRQIPFTAHTLEAFFYISLIIQRYFL